MPVVSRFFGIAIAFYWQDHLPPHFHAFYSAGRSPTSTPWSKTMILHVTEATYERDYLVHVKFNDGPEGFVDLADELYGEVFAPLKDVKQFKAFRVDPELKTIVWNNGADLAPEFLHDRLLVVAEPADQPEQQ